MADNIPQKKKVTKKTVETVRTIETIEMVDVPEEKENPPPHGNLFKGYCQLVGCGLIYWLGLLDGPNQQFR